MNYKDAITAKLTVPGARMFDTQKEYNILERICDDIDYAWNMWPHEDLSQYFVTGGKPTTVPIAFISDWIYDEDFEADGYDVDLLHSLWGKRANCVE